MKESLSLKKRAMLLTLFLIILVIGSILAILFSNRNADKMIANIYQNGDLLYSIDLSTVSKPYTLNIQGVDGGYNTVSVQPNKIAITSANCPDKLCVKQGTISSPLLPITCLPNHLVIQLSSKENEGLDITSH